MNDELTHAEVIGGRFNGQRWCGPTGSGRFKIKPLGHDIYAVYVWHDGAWVHVREMRYVEYLDYRTRAAMTPDCGGKG